MIFEMRDARGSLPAIAQITDCVFRQRLSAGHVLAHNLIGQFRSGPIVEHPGATGHLDVQQGLSEAQTKGADFGHVSGDLLLFQGGLYGRNDFESTGSFARQSSADPYPGAVSGGQALPPTAGLVEDRGEQSGALNGHGCHV
jgi:hypothetical protein